MNTNKLHAQAAKVGVQAFSAFDKLAARGAACKTPKAGVGELEVLVNLTFIVLYKLLSYPCTVQAPAFLAHNFKRPVHL